MSTSHRDSTRGARADREQGLAMLVVMLVLMMVTATAVFAIHATGFEMRAAGYNRQAVQTHYVAETGLNGAAAWVDSRQPATLVAVAQQTLATGGTRAYDIRPFEPPLGQGVEAYRLGASDIDALSGLPGPSVTADVEMLGGARQTLVPFYVVDVYDIRRDTSNVAGNQQQGVASATYVRATYTSRGRTRLPGDFVSGDGTLASLDHDPAGFHEGATDGRALGRSGPCFNCQ